MVAVFILGMSNPFVLLLTSSNAEASDDAPDVLMAKPCENAKNGASRESRAVRRKILITGDFSGCQIHILFTDPAFAGLLFSGKGTGRSLSSKPQRPL